MMFSAWSLWISCNKLFKHETKTFNIIPGFIIFLLQVYCLNSSHTNSHTGFSPALLFLTRVQFFNEIYLLMFFWNRGNMVSFVREILFNATDVTCFNKWACIMIDHVQLVKVPYNFLDEKWEPCTFNRRVQAQYRVNEFRSDTFDTPRLKMVNFIFFGVKIHKSCIGNTSHI